MMMVGAVASDAVAMAAVYMEVVAGMHAVVVVVAAGETSAEDVTMQAVVAAAHDSASMSCYIFDDCHH